MFDIRMTT